MGRDKASRGGRTFLHEPDEHGFVIRLMQVEDAFSVLLETDYLEGIRESSRTKDERQFEHELYPYWHKHFTTSRHALKNIGIHWGLDKTGNPRLARMLNEVARTHGHDADQWPGLVAYQLVLGGYQERAHTGLTRDWIVFAKHNGLNYYLRSCKARRRQTANRASRQIEKW